MEVSSASDPAKKKRRNRGKRGNTAVSNPPKEHMEAAPQSQSRSAQLLAQLAAAQSGSSQTPVIVTTHGPRPSQFKEPALAAKPNSGGRRTKESSVGARMARQPPPRLAPLMQALPKSRNRYPSTSATTSQPSLPPRGPKIPDDVLDDISFRFLLNLPDSEKGDETRVCFQIELAHWFYVDFYVNQQERQDCPNVNLRDFLKFIFMHNDFLKPLAKRADQVVDNWRLYKSTVPTYGAILLDSSLNYVLLVQGYYSSKNNWGFPKGKVNESEAPRACAVREVLEETGFDFGEHSAGNECRIQKFLNDTMIRLYIVPDVPTDYDFAPKTRCEIRKMQWFSIWDLPTDRFDQIAEEKGFPARHFYGVVPFVNDIQSYAKKELLRREKVKKDKKDSSVGSTKKSSAFSKVLKKTPEEKRSFVERRDGESSLSSLVSQGPKETLFRPLREETAPPGSHLAHIMASSSAATTPHRRNVAVDTGFIAHPVPIRGIPSDRPVYEAPKEVTVRAVKRVVDKDAPCWKSCTSSPSCSASQLEDVLTKMLLPGAAKGVVECCDGSEKTPDIVQPSLHSPIHPIFEVREAPVRRRPLASGRESICSRDSRNGKHPLGVSTGLTSSTQSLDFSSRSLNISPFQQFQLCSAWNSFALNQDAILAPFYSPIASYSLNSTNFTCH